MIPGKLEIPLFAPGVSARLRFKDAEGAYLVSVGGASEEPPLNRPTREETSGISPRPLPKTVDAILSTVLAVLLPLLPCPVALCWTAAVLVCNVSTNV